MSSRPDPKPAFQDPHYWDINAARLDHLASVLEQMGSQAPRGTVLELGAGIGDHSAFWIDRGHALTTSDGRPECVDILKERFPGQDVRLLDLDAELAVQQRFDIVYAYGLLYHLKNPALALESMGRLCGDVLFVETCVSFGDDLAIHPVPEPADSASQSIHGLGCRPTRPWVFETLKAHFPHVYQVGWQPNHEQFPTDWRDPSGTQSVLHRAIFIASRRILDVPGLVEHLLDRQTRSADRATSPQSGDLASLIARHGIDTVLDVGANIGQFASGLRSSGYEGRIVSFEPQRAAFQALERISAHDPLWSCRQLALGSEAGALMLNVSANSYSSSFLKPEASTLISEPAVGYVSQESVRVERLDALWPEIGGRQTLLKIDVQGFEREVLAGAEECLPGIQLLFLEVSLVSIYEGEPLIETMLDLLRSKGFAPVWIGPGFVDRATGQMYQCDIAFSRF
jgi:FkbM family methyltransferase